MMELLSIDLNQKSNNELLTMSSREIAELVETRHDTVKRSINRLQIKGLIQLTPLVEVKNHLGQVVSEYHLIKRDTYVVVAQLCPEFTARLVDRWQELEDQHNATPQLPQNYLEALEALVEKEKANQALAIENQSLKPKSEAYDRIATYSDGSMNLTNAAKHLQIKPKALTQFLSTNRWIYRRLHSKPWIAYQSKLQAGLLEHKVSSYEDKEGNSKISEQVLVTAKGLTKLATMLNGEK